MTPDYLEQLLVVQVPQAAPERVFRKKAQVRHELPHPHARRKLAEAAQSPHDLLLGLVES